MTQATGASTWAQWLGRRMAELGFGANSDLARAAGVPDSVISRWRTTGTTPSLTQLRRLQRPLNATLLQLLVASGHLTAEEAQAREVAAPVRIARGVREAVLADPDLDEDLRHLHVVQYEAMLAVARARAATEATPAR
jgi:transcriptional regulator with XRE-family HTH domain